MAHATDIRVPTAGFAERIAGLAEGFRRRRAERELFRATFDELSRLSDRELADVGIHRSQIATIARSTVRKGF